MLRSFNSSRRAFDRGTLLGHQVLFFEPDGGANPSGGTGGQGGSGGQGAADDRQNLQGLLARHQGDAMAVVATLLSENHGLRDERRTLRGQIPAQGAVVLTPEQAQQWTAYQGLGDLAALQQQIQQSQTAQSELAGLRREKLIGDVAAIGDGTQPYKASVLNQLPGADKLDFQIREADGKKSVVVKVGDKETPLADYVKTTWADFMPALTAVPGQQNGGTSFVQQNAGGGAPSGIDAALKRFQDQRDAAANPLNPAAAAAARSPLA